MSSPSPFEAEMRDIQRAKARKLALENLRGGCFELPAAKLTELRIRLSLHPGGFTRAVYDRTLLDDTFEFARMVDHSTTFDELERRLYDLPPDLFRVKGNNPLDRAHYSTKDTHLPQIYLECRHRRSWEINPPSPADLGQFYLAMRNIGVSSGAVSPNVTEYPDIIDELTQAYDFGVTSPTLTEVSRRWIGLSDVAQENRLTQLVWFTSLPALLAHTGLLPFGALSFGKGFSYLSFYNEPSIEARLVYMAGALVRSANDCLDRVHYMDKQIRVWSDKLTPINKGVPIDALPWLLTRVRFRVSDLTQAMGCHRSHSHRAVDALVAAGVIQPVTDQKRNKIYTPLFRYQYFKR